MQVILLSLQLHGLYLRLDFYISYMDCICSDISAMVSCRGICSSCFLGLIDRLSEHIGMETKRTLQIFVGRRVQRQNCHRTGAFCSMLPNKRKDHSVDDLWHCGHSKPPAELDICGFSYYTDGSVLTAPEPDNTTIPTIKSARRSS